MPSLTAICQPYSNIPKVKYQQMHNSTLCCSFTWGNDFIPSISYLLLQVITDDFTESRCSPHNIHSYTAQYLHIGRHTVVTDTGKTLKTIRSQVPSNLTGNNTTDVLTVGLLHLLNLFVHQRTYNYILIFSWHYPLTNLGNIRFTPTSSSHRWCHFTQSKWWVIILLI